jgi:hypothetical protein
MTDHDHVTRAELLAALERALRGMGTLAHMSTGADALHGLAAELRREPVAPCGVIDREDHEEQSSPCPRPKAALRAEAERLRGDAAALRRVIEDCHAHDLYVLDGDAGVNAYRKHHPGVRTDESAGDHYDSCRRAVAGELGGAMLDELRLAETDCDAMRAARDRALAVLDDEQGPHVGLVSIARVREALKLP